MWKAAAKAAKAVVVAMAMTAAPATPIFNFK